MFDIIIPIYRMDPTLLQRCLDSVFKQSLSDSEYDVWIVDGTPPDAEQYQGCMDVIQDFRFHPKFNYFRQSGTGVSQARNEAVTLGKNPYVAWLDGDDYWYPLHLEELKKCIDNTTDDHVLWWNAGDVTLTYVWSNGEPFESKKTFNWIPNHAMWSDKYHGLHFRFDATLFPSSVAVSRLRFEEVGGFLEEVWLGEDQLLWYHLCGDGRSDEKVYLSYQNDFVGAYREHQENYLQKGQNPWVDIYGDNAEEKCSEDLKENYLKYWGILSEWNQPEDISDEEWNDIITLRRFESTVINKY
jgi:glycosyltransferase involved in cell wall biosynthesis